MNDDSIALVLDWDIAFAHLLAGNFCKYCQSMDLHVEGRLQAKEIGTYSLAGVQMKRAMEYWPWLVCRNCGHESKGQ